MINNKRNKRGNMLCLSVCVIALVFVPVLMLFCRLGLFSVYNGRAQNVVEAAAKVAAIDLSRIVINDPEFGYVSLSNHAPVGKATLAQDGEPLPVTGINTLIGTLRQNALIADELQNDTMQALVDKDLAALENTLKDLGKELTDSLSERHQGKAIDVDGKSVTTFNDVKTFLEENLPHNVQVESVELSLGWLKGGSETQIQIPRPEKLAQVRLSEVIANQYAAFKEYPVGRKSFSFAGLDSQAHLVSSQKFRKADGKHISSILKITCNLIGTDEPRTKFQCVACCQPYTQPDVATHGAMTLRFAGRPVPGLLSWNEFLANGSFRDNRITAFDVVGGDYPFEKESQMQQTHKEEHTGTAQQFAEHLYYWLRNGHVRPRLDAVLSMINEPFRPYANEVYTYEFADDGSIVRNVMDGNRFTRPVAADGQFAAMADTRVTSGASAIIFFRDNVCNQSTEGSKHAGQPLAGYPLNNSESGSTDHQQLALNFSKRSAFQHGLALDIEIGGTADRTAKDDVLSMRQRTRSRRI
jgi:hypothetical protein